MDERLQKRRQKVSGSHRIGALESKGCHARRRRPAETRAHTGRQGRGGAREVEAASQRRHEGVHRPQVQHGDLQVARQLVRQLGLRAYCEGGAGDKGKIEDAGRRLTREEEW